MIKITKELIPPVIYRLYKNFNKQYGFFGNYKSWQEAKKQTTGYDSAKILQKVKASSLKVSHGEAVYERDSVIFNHVEYSWPLLVCLLYIAGQNANKLSVLDFGGSLGSSYYQNIKFLSHLEELHWDIVEQPGFVKVGRESFQNNQLQFYYNIEEAMRNNKPDVLLLSSVVQYLEDPYAFLEKIKKYSIPYIIFDRTGFMKRPGEDKLMIQKVNPKIYEGNMPVWFLNITRFKAILQPYYEIIATFDALDTETSWAKELGFLLKLSPIKK